jgi:hypothetical protein
MTLNAGSRISRAPTGRGSTLIDAKVVFASRSFQPTQGLKAGIAIRQVGVRQPSQPAELGK